MIVVGAYPWSMPGSNGGPPLGYLRSILSELLSPHIGLHLLPMWPSTGDGGFAVADWTEVDPRFGTLDDLRRLAQSRPLLLDGIYNHVSWEHPIARAFLADPETNGGVLHAFSPGAAPDAPLAPRGGSVLLPIEIGGRSYEVWHTFGTVAVDVNLEDGRVLQDVFDNIDLLARLGSYAVRLDAIEYYSKPGSEPHRVADRIISHAHSRNLVPILQVDSADPLAEYEPLLASRPVLIDHSFSSFLCHGYLAQEPSYLARHLKLSESTPNFRVLRPVRTHDGVFMRSRNQDPEFLDSVVQLFQGAGLQLRYTNGALYETNHSLPHLLGVHADEELFERRLVGSLIVATMTSTIAYVLLNSLLGQRPEEHLAFGEDPRQLQRQPLTRELLTTGPWSRYRSLPRALDALASLVGTDTEDEPAFEVEAQGPVLMIRSDLGRRVAAINFSQNSQPLHVPPEAVLFECGFSNNTLGPCGSVLASVV